MKQTISSSMRLMPRIACLHTDALSSKMEAIPSLNRLTVTITGMKRDEKLLMTPEQIAESHAIGERIARLRRARNVLQSEAAIRAGISRPTATLIEAGDPGR